MKIFFNGDSHTSGSELLKPKEECYSYRLANLLDAEVVGNPAVGGAGNDRILRTTEDYLRECNGNYPDLIVIGWSECTRFDWFYNGQYRTANSGEDGLSNSDALIADPKRLKDAEILGSIMNVYCLSQYFHNQMYNLHCKLEHLKIPHLFFMANAPLNNPLSIHQRIGFNMETFNSYKDLVLSISPNYFNLAEVNWNKSFYKPYDEKGSFLDWGIDRDYKETEMHHLPKQAHEEFSYLLINYIKSNIL